MINFGFGFFCSTADNSLSTNHRISLKNLSEKNLLSTFEKNCQDLLALLKLSHQLGCSIFRLGSQFVPFLTHPDFKPAWWQTIKKRLMALSPEVKKFGLRLTMHPSQFVVLNSDSREVIDRSLAEIDYHFFVLDHLGVDENGVVIIHIGKSKEDKKTYLKKFIKKVKEEKWLRRRLVIENDDSLYTVADALFVFEETGLPVVFDYFHHKLNPSAIDLKKVIISWQGRTPEFHLSSQNPQGKRGEHSDFVVTEDIDGFLQMTGSLPYFDLIIEAKKKELAIIDFKKRFSQSFKN